MHPLRKTIGDTTYFIIADINDPIQIQAAKDLAYNPIDEGYAHPFPTTSPHLDFVYNTFCRSIEMMVLQKAGIVATPWQLGLENFLNIVEGQNIDWWLIGSAAVAVRGIDIEPGDIDLGTSESDALRLANLLLNHMVEPIQDATGWVGKWFARAFLDVSIEWLGGVNESADAYGISDFGPIAISQLETIDWHGHQIRVPPLRLSYEVNLRRNRKERAEKIYAAL